MDAAHNAAGAINGFDILLWAAFLYLVPRLLRWQPRRPHQTPTQGVPRLVTEEIGLKIA